MTGFDRLAPVYDKLARFVFGKSIVRAQVFFLGDIRAGSRVLILGGGTGWLLEELLKVQPDCEVWYIESSSRMMELSKQRCGHHTNVRFILATHSSIPEMMYDVVIMNFFLDVFSPARIFFLVDMIRAKTQQEGIWIVTDFDDEGKWWQRALAAMMISFFRMVCSVEARKLADLKTILASGFMTEHDVAEFFHGFIKTRIFVKGQPS
jgi:tRNA (cmo5U34)-methyltransferase